MDQFQKSPEEALNRNAEFMNLVTPNQGRIFGYIFALVQNATDAHDVYQQTLLTLWRKYDEFEPGTNFSAWAMRTAQLECLSHLRLRRRNQIQFNEDVVNALMQTQQERTEHVGPDERQVALTKCMERLNKNDSSLLQKCYQQGAKIRDVARELGRSSQSICNSLKRVRVAMLKCINMELGEGQ